MYNKIFIKEVDSTNNYLMTNSDELVDKTVLYTENQTAGRGRFNRVWKSDNSENLYFSILLKPEIKEHVSSLTQYVSVILCKLLENYGVNPSIKWPNDVLIDGKKISGILAESSLKGSKFNALVLGIGVNLNMEEEELAKIDKPATSLNVETGKRVDKEAFLDLFLEMFFENYEKFLELGFVFIRNDYISRASFLNKEVCISKENGILRGKALDITENGALLFLDENKEERVILTGDLL